MDYSEAREAFFAPREGDAQTLSWTTPARRLRDAIEPLATVCFWSEPAYDAYAARGLDFLGGYVWSRGSALGEADPAVVAAAFGVFEPSLVTGVLADARALCSLSDIRAAKVEGATTALRTVLGEPDSIEDVLDPLRRAVAAAPSVGRPMFAGLAALDLPDDPWAQVWHLSTLLREHRGDGHLAAVVGAGLSGLEANIVTERWVGFEPLTYAGSRAWSPEAMSEATSALEARGLLSGDGLSDSGRALRDGIEESTDAAEQPVLDALGSEVEGVVSALEGWAARVVEHGWFPPDPYKRAAG